MGFCANTSWDRCAFPENASAHYHMETLKTYTSKPLNISLKEQLLFNRLCRKNFPKISEVTVVSIALCVKLIYVVRAFVEGCSWSGNSVTHKTPFHAKKVKASQTHLHTFLDGSPKFQCNLKVSSRCIIHSFLPTWPMFFIFYFIPYGLHMNTWEYKAGIHADILQMENTEANLLVRYQICAHVCCRRAAVSRCCQV